MFSALFGSERPMLATLAVACLLTACQEPDRATGPSLSQAALPNSITLTYICGNSFRVRNTNPAATPVTWDVYKTSETGSLLLPPKPASGPYSETYLTTVNKGTVRLFLDGALIQTKANGNKPVCQLPADTAKPAIPPYGYPSDRAYLSAMDTDSAIYYRRLLSVSFVPGTSGSVINQFLVKYSAVIVGGRPAVDAYIVQVPDPGPSLDSLSALRSRMNAEPGVLYVILLMAHSPPPIVEARFPRDGLGFTRAGWSSESASDPLWGLKAIRAPLAWGCEAGIDGAPPVTIGVVEWRFRGTDASDDLTGQPNPVRRFAARSLEDPMVPGQAAQLAWHGSAVTGVLTASGDNDSGVAGVIWRTSHYLYSLSTPTPAHPDDEYLALVDEVIPMLKADRPHVVNLSIELTKSMRNPRRADELSQALQSLLASDPNLLLVKAAGNDPAVLTPGAVADLQGGGVLLLDAVLRARQAGYRDQILLVGGSARGPNGIEVGTEFTFVDGETDIVAPARAVRVLGGQPFAEEVVDRNGTSFAAPMVAGVAAQLLAMQPNLTPAEVKHYIMAGAQEPRLDPTTGLVIGPEQLRLTRTGASQSVYQLDAYGALTLLSRSDPSTPVCGFPVVSSFVSDPETGDLQTSVRLARPGHLQEEVYRGAVENVTVAQGGRRIGLDGDGHSFDLVFDGLGYTDVHPVSFRGYRQFLEHDTAFVDYNSSPNLLTIRGPGGSSGPYDLCTGVAAFLPAFGTACYPGPLAGTGGHAVVTVNRNNYDITGCGPGRAFTGSYLVSVGGDAAPQAVREVSFDPCAPQAGSWTLPEQDAAAWRADGAVAWVAMPDATYQVEAGAPIPGDPNPPGPVITTASIRTVFTQAAVNPGISVEPDQSVPGRSVYALGWRADGSALVSYEYLGLDWIECGRTIRAGKAPQREILDSSGPVSWCGNRVMEPLGVSRFLGPLATALARPSPSALPARHRTPQRLVLVN